MGYLKFNRSNLLRRAHLIPFLLKEKFYSDRNKTKKPSLF